MINTTAKLAGIFVGLLGASSHAQITRPVMDMQTALEIQSACLAHGKNAGHGMAVAIYDHAGVLITFAKMDEASTAVGEIAKWKGKSAATYGFATAQTAEWNGPAAPNMATFMGGLPLFDKDGILVGGVGVSGAPSEFDEECGRKGATEAGLSTERP